MAVGNTIGSRFKNLCFIGLNRVEYFPEKSDEAIFADSWQDVTDEQSRKNLALLFFSPRDLDGEPVSPYIYLADDANGVGGNAHDDDDEDMLMGQQTLGDIPLIDLCRITGADANTVNIIAVADILFHWDINDSYIQPTSSTSWVRDIQQIIATYPRSTNYNVYTNWDPDKLQEIKVTHHPIKELPLDTTAWLNMPTFQEKYGMATLIFSLMVAAGTYGLTYTQGSELQNLSRQIAAIEQDSPQTAGLNELTQQFSQQEAHMKYRHLMPLLFKDISSAIYNSGMQAEFFEIKNLRPQTPPEKLIASITAKQDAYKGWLQEEPIAKALLSQSVTMAGIRKPPGGKQFRLEGLIDLASVNAKVDTYKQQVEEQQKQPPQSDVTTENAPEEEAPAADASELFPEKPEETQQP